MAFMDDMTILEPDVTHARDMFARLDISWCRMTFKPKKPESLSIVKDNVAATTISVAGQAIPAVVGTYRQSRQSV